MLYQKQTFTLPAAPARITQTDWEIAMGLRTPDGHIKEPEFRRGEGPDRNMCADCLICQAGKPKKK